MDTSEDYIKMCEKANLKKAQREDEDVGIEPGDWFFDKALKRVVCVADGGWFYGRKTWIFRYQAGGKWGDHSEFLSSDIIPLWRQDQLQEMVEDKTRPAWHLVSQFADWCKSQRKDIAFGFASMEQIWLAFVMKEKFKKVWNEEDWVKEG